ncbi:MAG: hypothetical protein JWQ70_3061 [Aeromicrobium sp.]|nr:hypothetical protein [Aeromicrobium sp.]
MTLHMRRATVTLAAGALLLAFAPAVPAFAATKTTVTGTVLDTAGNPVRGVSVVAFNLADDTDGFVEFSATKADGTFSRTRYGQLGPGDWAFIFQDSSDENVAIESDQTLVTGANTLSAPVHLQKGATVSGLVTARSGTPLKNIDVQVYNQALDVDDPSTIDPSISLGGIGDSYTDVDGTYDVRPLITGTYDYGVSFGDGDDFHALGHATIGTVGATLTLYLFNLRVPVDTSITAKASKSKGKATVTASVDASYFGIDSPGGSVTVYDGSKKLSTKTLGSDGTASVSLSSLKKGKHSLHYTFSGATDTTATTSATAKITVK